MIVVLLDEVWLWWWRRSIRLYLLSGGLRNFLSLNGLAQVLNAMIDWLHGAVWHLETIWTCLKWINVAVVVQWIRLREARCRLIKLCSLADYCLRWMAIFGHRASLLSRFGVQGIIVVRNATAQRIKLLRSVGAHLVLTIGCGIIGEVQRTWLSCVLSRLNYYFWIVQSLFCE